MLTALTALGLACSAEPESAEPEDTASGAEAVRPLVRAAHVRGHAALGLDDRGRPHLLRAARRPPGGARASAPERAARDHVAALAPVWGAGAAPLADLRTAGTVALPGGGSLVLFEQEVGGIEIEGARLRVLLDRDRNLHAVGGARELAVGAPRPERFRLDAAAAVAASAADRFGAGAAIGPVHDRRVLYRDGDELRPAWQVELYGAPADSSASTAWRVIVDAETGAILSRASLTADATFTYRVFADAGGDRRPFDGPQQSYLPHPSGIPDSTQPAFVAPVRVTIDGFNAPADPWLAAGATTTRGNNVDAYVDLNDGQDGFTAGVDFRASTTAAGEFDRIYNTALGPLASTSQQMAATTNLFYVVNWLHDWWYDSGFTEVAGNAQLENYGRGGAAGDILLAEAQDNAIGGPGVPPSRNNANMSTPSDGLSPRMQMFLWTGASAHTLTAPPGGTAFGNGIASFGPQVFDVTDTLVVAVDGAAPTSDACSAVGNVSGHIALVDRGNCSFAAKATNLRNGGAVGMILINDGSGTVDMDGNGGTLPPSLSVSANSGTALRALVQAGGASARMVRTATGVERDGDLDNVIVAHEWGHYFHHRLQRCNTVQCGAMSEGWGDFMALHTMLRPTDNLQGTYSVGVYGVAAFADAYFGIRRAPYSVNFARNGFTFAHIQDSATLPTTFPIAFSGNNAEPHNAGEIWAAMLWEAYVALIQARGHAAGQRAFGNYAVAGLLLSPVDATFTETRDSILTAAAATSTADAVTLAHAFARRGAGSCAASPPRNSTDLDGVVESFTVSGELAIGDVTLSDDRDPCDADGILDGGEAGTLRIEVINQGAGALSATALAVSSPTAGITIEGVPAVPAVPAFSSAVVEVPVALSDSVSALTQIQISVTASDPGSCSGGASASATIRGHHDTAIAASATDDVESETTVWTPTGSGAGAVWSRTAVPGLTTVWHGVDTPAVSDTQLMSPPVVVGPGLFTVSFRHRFDFEATTGPTTFWDGGVIELSTNDGQSWVDVTTLGATPGYVGTLTTISGNPLGGRQAYARRNPSYPARDLVTLAFGLQLAGDTVRLRFRIGTDESAAANGWDIDDIAFSGITNTPFAVLTDEDGICAPPPPDAGSSSPDASGVDPGPDASSTDTDAGAEPDPDGDGGCGCRATGTGGATGAWLAIAAALWVFSRRRRTTTVRRRSATATRACRSGSSARCSRAGTG